MTRTNCDKQDVPQDLRYSVRSGIMYKTMMCANQMVQRIWNEKKKKKNHLYRAPHKHSYN